MPTTLDDTQINNSSLVRLGTNMTLATHGVAANIKCFDRRVFKLNTIAVVQLHATAILTVQIDMAFSPAGPWVPLASLDAATTLTDAKGEVAALMAGNYGYLRAIAVTESAVGAAADVSVFSSQTAE